MHEGRVSHSIGKLVNNALPKIEIFAWLENGFVVIWTRRVRKDQRVCCIECNRQRKRWEILLNEHHSLCRNRFCMILSFIFCCVGHLSSIIAYALTVDWLKNYSSTSTRNARASKFRSWLLDDLIFHVPSNIYQVIWPFSVIISDYLFIVIIKDHCRCRLIHRIFWVLLSIKRFKRSSNILQRNDLTISARIGHMKIR